jgi:hypothetical protein
MANTPISDQARDEVWKEFDLRIENFNSIGRAQRFYVEALCLHLALVWTWSFVADQESKVELLGLQLKTSGLWQVTPLVITVLSLAFAGTRNIMAHSWARICQSAAELGKNLFFYELDRNKSFIDYLGYTRLRRELPLPMLPEQDAGDYRWQFSLLAYPALLSAALYTTAFSYSHLYQSRSNFAYVVVCLALQSVFLFQLLIDRGCRFLFAPGSSQFTSLLGDESNFVSRDSSRP